MEDRKPLPNLGLLRNFLRFLWNRNNKTVMNRTCGSWAKLIIFYTLFFGVLGGIFVGMIYLIEACLMKSRGPIIQFEDGPGLGYRPIIHLTSPIIWFKWNKHEDVTYKDYVKELKKFLRGYKDMNMQKVKMCHGKETSDDIPCFFDITDLGPCAEPDYGYNNNTPCVYLKLNKVYDWKPECYESSSIPKDMPSRLQHTVRESFVNTSEGKLWVSCEGVFPADEEHMGEIQYFPEQWFNPSFFPYKGQENFLSPLIAVKFLNPQLGILISVQCKVWARNIKEETSVVDFQLMIGFKDDG